MRNESTQHAGGAKANKASPVRATSCTSKSPCNWTVLVQVYKQRRKFLIKVSLTCNKICPSALLVVKRSSSSKHAAGHERNKRWSNFFLIFSCSKLSSSSLLSHVHNTWTKSIPHTTATCVDFYLKFMQHFWWLLQPAAAPKGAFTPFNPLHFNCYYSF